MGAVRGWPRLSTAVAAVALTSAAAAPDASLPDTIEAAARTHITRAALEAPIRFLCSDLLGARRAAIWRRTCSSI
jgi:hypothetical protein